jgi:hypothetical protein
LVFLPQLNASLNNPIPQREITLSLTPSFSNPPFSDPVSQPEICNHRDNGLSNGINIPGSSNPTARRLVFPNKYCSNSNTGHPDPFNIQQSQINRPVNRPSPLNTITPTPSLVLPGRFNGDKVTVAGVPYNSVKEAKQKCGLNLTEANIWDRLINFRSPDFFWGWSNGGIPAKFKVDTSSFSGFTRITFKGTHYNSADEAPEILQIEKKDIVKCVYSADYPGDYYGWVAPMESQQIQQVQLQPVAQIMEGSSNENTFESLSEKERLNFFAEIDAACYQNPSSTSNIIDLTTNDD